MMALLKNTRIKNKIITIIFLTGALSAILGSVISYYYQVQQTKNQLVTNTLLVSTLLSEYCGTPLEFARPDKALEVLEKLHSIPDVYDGVLFDMNGVIFASYHKSKNPVERIPSELKSESTFVHGNYIHVAQPIHYKGHTYGTLYLRSHIDWKSILIGHLRVAISIIMALLILVYILSRLLHKSISQPIVHLTEKMNMVAQNKDYSIHFNNLESDEIGELYMGFSTMLSEINKKENELRATNESLRINKEKTNSLLDKIPYPISTANEEGFITFINERFVQVFGYTENDMLTIEDWWQKAYPNTDYRKQVQHTWSDAIKKAQEKGGDIEALEYEVTCKDGEKRVVEISGIILEDRLLATFIDLTEKKKAEMALIESEERYSKAFQTAPYAITITDPHDNKLIDINNEFTRISGFTREEVLGKKIVELNLWVNPEERIEFVDLLKQGQEVSNKEYALRKKNGETIIALVSGTLIKINTKTYLLSSVLDITSRKKAEEALLKSEEKYRTIFENVQDVFFQTSLDGVILDISPSVYNFLGIDRFEMIGKSVADFYYNPNDRFLFIANLQAKGTVNDFEIQLKSNVGEMIYASLNASIVTGISISHIQGIIRDISDRKKTELIKEDLKVATSRLSLATHSAGIGIWEWNIETEELVWSEQMHKLFGLDYSTQKPKNWRDYVYPDDLNELQEKVDECIQTDQELSTDFRTKLPSGEIRFLQVKGNIYRSDETPTRMLGVCWDISDRKKSEEQLLQSEATLYATINNTTFFIWSLDRTYRILNLNRPFRNFLKEQYQVDVEAGQCLDEFAAYNVEEFSINWSQNYIRALAGESFELTEERNGRHFKYSLNPLIENAIITGVTVFMEENTDIKSKEKALMKANEQIGELKVAALRSAMNPHFIFNTLNSIQYFILKNDSLNAVNYLSTFSKLIRSILNNSVNNKIKLSEEIEQLKNYVHLELLRFENKFDFELNLDEELDVENIEVSSMLIQPYIENAILHGLYTKEEKGVLKVSVKEEGNSILFSIEDNGIGREASFKHNFHRSMSHKSLGTHLTEERLKLLQNQNGTTVEIEDLYMNGLAAGTKVKIWVN